MEGHILPKIRGRNAKLGRNLGVHIQMFSNIFECRLDSEVELFDEQIYDRNNGGK